MATGAAADVGDFEIVDIAQKWIGDAFFERDEGVAIGVVDLRPEVVTRAGGEMERFRRQRCGVYKWSKPVEKISTFTCFSFTCS